MTLYTASGSLPRHEYVWVDRMFLTDGEHTGWEQAVWFGLHAVRGRMWGLHVMLGCGAVYRAVPPHAIAWNKDAPAWGAKDAQTWDCYGQQFALTIYDYLDGLDCVACVAGADVEGRYLFTAVPCIDPYTHHPSQAKEFMFIRTDDWRLTIQPTNRVLFRDASFTDKDWPQWPTHLRSSDEVYQCE